MHLYILKDGKPIPEPDARKWGRWFQKADRVVEKTTIGEAQVSTVFLGSDHNFGRDGGRPVLWETMIFGGPHDQYQARYASRERAEAGHAAVVQALKSGLAPDESP
jgi:hypothetical protein